MLEGNPSASGLAGANVFWGYSPGSDKSQASAVELHMLVHPHPVQEEAHTVS